MKTIVHFKNKDLEWHIGVDLTNTFNGHTDDKKAIRKAVMAEIGKKWPDAKGFVQRVELKG